ncbi:MAG: hypothetical protein PHO67_08025 [Candidatus Omnitrophica bacterium]|nr:hypothetical protein [Candidatus Omnitrophota bacterium]
MLNNMNINRLKLAMILLRFHVIKSFELAETGEIRFIWPWMW